MGQDENKNGSTPIPNSGAVPTPTPNPRATFTSGNRLGMRPSRDFSMQEELDRISADSSPNQPQNGDIVLNNDAPESGNKKRILIILGIIAVFAVVVIIGVVIALAQRGSVDSSGGNSTPSASPTTAKTAFNEFYYYLTENSDKSSDISKDTIISTISYLDKNPELGASEKTSYLGKFKDKYNNLLNAYNKTSGDDSFDNIYPYFYSFQTLTEISDEDLLNRYLSDGIDNTKSYIIENTDSIEEDNETNSYLDFYIAAKRNVLLNYLILIDYANTNGCLVNGRILQSCDISGVEGVNEVFTSYDNALTEMNEYRSSLASAAYSEIESLYYEIYETENSGESV